MPIMPRPLKAQKISDKLMKKPKQKDEKIDIKKNGETDFDRQVRQMIKR